MRNLRLEKMDIGLLIKTSLLILLVRITCTCSGPKLMLENQIIEKPIESSLFFGKLVKQITDPTGCVILKIEGVVFRSWHLQNLSTWPRLVPTRGLESYLKVCRR